MDRTEYKLPDYSLKSFLSVKKKLNIKKGDPNSQSIKKTIVVKQEEHIATLFKYFNKITDKTYDKLSSEILTMVSHSTLDKKKVYDAFSKVVLNNAFFSSLYAKIYKGLIEIDDEFINILKLNIYKYGDHIRNISYVSPNDNYDKYCDHVKQIENIHNFTTFLVHCCKYQIIQIEMMIDLALTFQKLCLENIDDEEKILTNEIYVNNTIMIFKGLYSSFDDHSTWNDFIQTHKQLVDCDGDGKNKKIHFKLLDITENLS